MKRAANAREGVVPIPVVVEPVEIQVPLTGVLVQDEDIAVIVRIEHQCTEYRPRHCSLSSLGAVSYSESLYSLIFCTK